MIDEDIESADVVYLRILRVHGESDHVTWPKGYQLRPWSTAAKRPESSQVESMQAP